MECERKGRNLDGHWQSHEVAGRVVESALDGVGDGSEVSPSIRRFDSCGSVVRGDVRQQEGRRKEGVEMKAPLGLDVVPLVSVRAVACQR